MFDVKDEVNYDDMKMLEPILFYVFASLCVYAKEYNLPVKITSMFDEVDGRITETHRDGRALDISSRGWPEDRIKDACNQINKKHSDIGAFSKKDGVPRACVYHKIEDGVFHFHLQVRKNYGLFFKVSDNNGIMPTSI